jgi:hypothetical protein
MARPALRFSSSHEAQAARNVGIIRRHPAGRLDGLVPVVADQNQFGVCRVGEGGYRKSRDRGMKAWPIIVAIVFRRIILTSYLLVIITPTNDEL